jgi:broad specificity phosphatase PhoE
MKIYLVRHAQTLSRDGLNYDQSYHINLSPIGKNRAQILASFFKKEIKPDGLYSSPIRRAGETAEILSKELNLNVFFDERLREYAPSKVLAGVAFKEAKRRARLNKDISPVDGESFNYAAHRFIEFLKEISLKNNQKVIVVTHALVVQCALVNLFDLKYYPHLDEASVTEIEFQNGEFKLNYINDTSFVPFSFLRKIKNRIKLFFRKEDLYS